MIRIASTYNGYFFLLLDWLDGERDEALHLRLLLQLASLDLRADLHPYNIMVYTHETTG